MSLDARVHHLVIKSFVERGFAPSLHAIATEGAAPPEQVAASLRRLHDGHALVLHPGTTDVWIAHPFSSSPTATWVDGGHLGWWAPCLWCAMGIVTLAAPGRATVYARLGGEREEVRIELDAGRLVSDDLPVHFAVPARNAWDNVVHFCSTVLAFRSETDVAPWCARHALPRGDVVPLTKVMALARAWYGRHLDVDWRKWTVEEAQAVFDQVGLRGDAWNLAARQAGTF
jgi:hypothetical protein